MPQVNVYQRDDGSLSVRNHLFILPAVVCANQVAIDVARRNPVFKYIEHQHGCAQIGADLVQTQRIFSNLSIHPNVFASLFVSLGCEGMMTANLFAQSESRTKRPMKLVSIQGVGGTLKAQSAVEEWMNARQAEIASVPHVATDWGQLTVGFICDEDNPANLPPSVQRFVQQLADLGLSMIVPDNCEYLVPESSDVSSIDHGEIPTTKVAVMKAGSNQLETATGLAASGVHFTIHFAQQTHAFGNPIVPIIRFAVSETAYQKFKDDFDGILVDDDDVSVVFNAMQRIVEGELSAAEDLGMDDFALYRIGPTV